MKKMFSNQNSSEYKKGIVIKMIHGGDIYRNKITYDFSVNGNPIGMPKAVETALYDAIKQCGNYPDPSQETLLLAISKKYDVKKENIIVGNGASELFMAFMQALSPKKVLLPVPSFAGYEYVCRAKECEVVYHALEEKNGYAINEDILEKIDESMDCIFLANPNNPVGNTIEHKILDKILERAKITNTFVVLDECFLPFLDAQKDMTMVSQIKKYPNLLVVRAFTKIYGIPGVRLGYAFMHNQEFLQRLRNQLPEWNISIFAQNAGVAALTDGDYINETRRVVTQEREYLTISLQELGIKVYQGEANYLLLYAEKDLYDLLLKQNILIRDCSNYHGLQKGFYRIAVKDHKANEKLIEELYKIYHE